MVRSDFKTSLPELHGHAVAFKTHLLFIHAEGEAQELGQMEHRDRVLHLEIDLTPVELEIRGYNLNTLSRISNEVVRRMASVEGLSDIKSSTEGGNPEIQVLFKRDRLAALNLTLSQLAETIRGKVLGEIPTELHRMGRKVDIRVRLDEAHRDRLDDIRKLTVTTIDGRPITLDAVADLVVEEGPSEIRRVDQERVAIVSAATGKE